MGMDGRYEDPGFKAGAVVDGGDGVGFEMPGLPSGTPGRMSYGVFINDSG